jgi:hypothetical protein
MTHSIGTFEEERREVLDGVLEALCWHPPDPDEMAACGHLMTHLHSLQFPLVRSE